MSLTLVHHPDGIRVCAAILALAFSATGAAASSAEPDAPACIPIDRAGFEITKPGHYCVTQDIHTRLDFADHSAEPYIIAIRSSDVVVDLQGHRLGRGRVFTQHGGGGILVDVLVSITGAPPRNILIRHGLLTDFGKGLSGYLAARPAYDQMARVPVSLQPGGSWFYAPINLRLEDVQFRRCTTDVDVWDLKAAPPASASGAASASSR